MRVALFGGSFNPPHIGHIDAAGTVMEQLSPDKLIFITAGDPPHKRLESGSPGAKDRYQMTCLAAQSVENAEASDIEVKRPGKSYTVDTVRQLKKELGGAELLLMVGGDMFLTLESWYEFEALKDMVRFVVFERNDSQGEKINEYMRHIRDKYDAKTDIIKKTPIEISSTLLRRKLRDRQGSDMLSDRVYGYIIKKRLYGAKPDQQWLREKSYGYHKPGRIPHVEGCEQMARSLAKRWGADEEQAAESAILHDITKKLLPFEQLLLCEKYGIINDSAESGSKKLLHAKTGAALARDLFGVDDDVYNAIRWHTTGRRAMTTLEKVVYLADYIEPTREFDGVERLRELAFNDLDAAMVMGLEMSLEEIAQSGGTAHKNTVDALRDLLGEGEV